LRELHVNIKYNYLYFNIIITKILVLLKVTKKTHFCHAPQLWSLTDSRSHLINGKILENRLIWSILAQLRERLQPLATIRGQGFASQYGGETVAEPLSKTGLARGHQIWRGLPVSI
jgi:hypothetical protein